MAEVTENCGIQAQNPGDVIDHQDGSRRAAWLSSDPVEPDSNLVHG
jgi:hypothetical protein